jgi:metal-responsive CopG/Arc/MetJ family transcriptional regulator
MDMTRIRKPVNVPFDPDLLAELDQWLETRPFKITRAAFIEVAVRDLLASEKRKAKRS